MINKVQVSVKVLEISEECDFLIPVDMTVNNAVSLIKLASRASSLFKG